MDSQIPATAPRKDSDLGIVLGQTRSEFAAGAFASEAAAVPADSSKIQGLLPTPPKVGVAATAPVVSTSLTRTPEMTRLAAQAVSNAARNAKRAAAQDCGSSLKTLLRRFYRVVQGFRDRNVSKTAQSALDAMKEPPEEDDDSVQLSRKADEGVKENDKKIGLSQTRSSPAISEKFQAGESTVTMTLTVLPSRDVTKKAVEKRKELLEGIPDHEHQQEACEAQLATLDRESPYVHSTFSREVLPGDLSRRAVGEVPNPTIREVTVGGETSRSFQFGAMGDQRNTKTSLKELTLVVERRGKKKLLEMDKEFLGVKGVRTQEETKRLEEIINELQQIDDAEKGFNSKITGLEIELSDVEAKIKKLSTKKGDKKSDKECERLKDRVKVLAHILEDLRNPERVVVQRREILQSQMLFVVQTQMREEVLARGGALTGEMHVAHVSLLNPEKDSWNKMSQLSHNEKYLMEDMEQIFQEFDGRPIIFGEKDSSPFIDPEGVIHLPAPTIEYGEQGAPPSIDLQGVIHLPRQPEGDRPSYIAPGTMIQLHTHYGNVSVQSLRVVPKEENTKKLIQVNEKLLKDVQEGLKREIATLEGKQGRTQKDEIRLELLKRSITAVQETEKRIKTGKASYDSASSLDEACSLLGWRVSKGCYSSKDRGGYAGRKAALEEVMHAKEAEAKLLYLQAEGAKGGDAGEKLRAKADALMKEAQDLHDHVIGAINPGSCDMQFVRWTTSVPQRTLKVWPGLKMFKSVANAFKQLKNMKLDTKTSN